MRDCKMNIHAIFSLHIGIQEAAQSPRKQPDFWDDAWVKPTGPNPKEVDASEDGLYETNN